MISKLFRSTRIIKNKQIRGGSGFPIPDPIQPYNYKHKRIVK